MLNMKHDLNLNPFFDRYFIGFNTPSNIDNYPPHNIIKINSDLYQIELAVTGFDKNEVSVTQEGNSVKIVASKKADECEQKLEEYIFRGLSQRDFSKVFSLSDYFKVTSARCNNGILLIDIKREIPEEAKPKQIKIQ